VGLEIVPLFKKRNKTNILFKAKECHALDRGI
jgi:hypothetical protein